VFYYDVNRSSTSNASAGTENNVLRALTVANQRTALLTGLQCAARMAAAGGVIVRAKTGATAGTGGTAQTPGKRDPDAPAAATTWFNDATALTSGGTLVQRIFAACSAQGGLGGWFAAVPEQAIVLKPNAGANGNLDVTDVSGLISTNFDVAAEFTEA
jgi:hypothetical protein